ncbi:MAG: Hsp20/alpha crystallin family protein [Sulfuricurvum sp.]|uniref:Hsp20/alpha crystallin family protein n=1 Tax=Sulfuricurvum sp. TaxID=2025608 RepID=UPI00262C0C61|nr:Hsp20/alpha crystallin family protein [Sulfuricurvum sp.]MDD2369032.1 Hsp20/alpha crystallin family protein [Sulfuricurvum sp.]MDD5118628.1 Hsp20/alpha crystallin family protein [Sulfuricurvum sp.]
MLTTVSKRLLIALGAVPILVSAAVTSPQHKADTAYEQNNPYWEMNEMDGFFNHPFPRMVPVYNASTIKESDKAYLISIDLPGMDKKDISIETSGNRLMVSGERKEDMDNKEESKHSLSEFRQSYMLPEDANLEAISATSNNGVLKITVPKSAGKKVSRKVEIR